MNLFTEDVDYFETPYREISDREALRDEWRSIMDQEDINLEFEVYSRDRNKYTVKCSLGYFEDGVENKLKGVYLIELEGQNKCKEFWQYCQAE
jgi:hypothetical protein